MYLQEMTANSRILYSMETSSKKEDKVETKLKKFTTRKTIKEILKCLAVRMKKKSKWMITDTGRNEMKTNKRKQKLYKTTLYCIQTYICKEKGREKREEGKEGGKLKYSTQSAYNSGIGRENRIKVL